MLTQKVLTYLDDRILRMERCKLTVAFSSNEVDDQTVSYTLIGDDKWGTVARLIFHHATSDGFTYRDLDEMAKGGFPPHPKFVKNRMALKNIRIHVWFETPFGGTSIIMYFEDCRWFLSPYMTTTHSGRAIREELYAIFGDAAGLYHYIRNRLGAPETEDELIPFTTVALHY